MCLFSKDFYKIKCVRTVKCICRVLRVHENVMAVMMNTLGRRAQAQSDAQPSSPQPTEDNASKQKVSTLV